MTPTNEIVSRLYADAQPATRPAPDAGEKTQGAEFASLAGDFVDSLRAAEQTVEAGLLGRADPQAVVQALAATEMAIQTAVTVRDRVVEAYQEILRMPV
ncbi:flagellar hook-basal body complex protein FliE [Oceanibium sediminis]|uniref:flagellar hook-basal body complex protein FliE n=1 Tax=Oceanibium sediminis TaxID=2026339 RepID=UPI000DD39AE3|nr:flagellar hook-basal body complex protein FliE [Oceanibium sediminis]